MQHGVGITMHYLLNSPILTNYGSYHFTGPLSVIDARTTLQQPYLSAIGHQSTADLLSQLLDMPIEVKRQAVQMQAGDTALVFRLLQRIPEGTVLNADELQKLPYEFSLLTLKSPDASS